MLAERLKAEYGLDAGFEQSRFEICRWVTAKDKPELDKFLRAYPTSIAEDLDGAPVFMATSAFNLRYEQERWPDVRIFRREGLSGGDAALGRRRAARRGKPS